MLAVRNCCYVAVCSAARGALAPTEEERGWDISWRPPAYSLLMLKLISLENTRRQFNGTIRKQPESISFDPIAQ